MEIEANGTYDLITNGVQSVPITINVSAGNVQAAKDVTITSNTTTTIVPDEGYGSMSTVVVDTKVPKTIQLRYLLLNTGESIDMWSKNITTRTGTTNETYTVPDDGYGFYAVWTGSYSYIRFYKAGETFEYRKFQYIYTTTDNSRRFYRLLDEDSNIVYGINIVGYGQYDELGYFNYSALVRYDYLQNN